MLLWFSSRKFSILESRLLGSYCVMRGYCWPTLNKRVLGDQHGAVGQSAFQIPLTTRYEKLFIRTLRALGRINSLSDSGEISVKKLTKNWRNFSRQLRHRVVKAVLTSARPIFRFFDLTWEIHSAIISTYRPRVPHSRVGGAKLMTDEHFHDFAKILSESIPENNLRGYLAQDVD